MTSIGVSVASAFWSASTCVWPLAGWGKMDERRLGRYLIWLSTVAALDWVLAGNPEPMPATSAAVSRASVLVVLSAAASAVCSCCRYCWSGASTCWPALSATASPSSMVRAWTPTVWSRSSSIACASAVICRATSASCTVRE